MKQLELNTSKLKLQKEKITDLVDTQKVRQQAEACSGIIRPTTYTQPFSVCIACPV
jgi:hypothetical protein